MDVNQLREKGNNLYADKRYQEALELYSQALHLEPSNYVLLSNRSAAYAHLGLYENALADASESIQQNRKWLKGYVRKAIAEIGLGRLAEAKQTCLVALKIDPSSDLVADTLEDVSRRLRDSNVPNRRPTARVVSDEFDCALCQCLLYQPVTTPCGHSYCKRCLQRALDHSISQCPLCRCQLHLGIGASLSINVTFDKLLKSCFPEEYEERHKETEATERVAVSDTAQTVLAPVFYLNAPALPLCSFSLHIFEPRYRLMIRRCLEGSRRFLLVAVTRNGEPSRVGTLLEIQSHELLPDGRSLIDTKGVGRLRVIDTEPLDGYAMATCVPFEDDDVTDNQLSNTETAEAAEQIKTRLRSIISDQNSPASRVLRQCVQESAVDLDTLSPVQVSWIVPWICRLPAPLLQQLVETRSPMERLRHIAAIFS